MGGVMGIYKQLGLIRLTCQMNPQIQIFDRPTELIGGYRGSNESKLLQLTHLPFGRDRILKTMVSGSVAI